MRSDADYGLYDAAHSERLHFIRRYRDLRMSLNEVQILLDFHDQPDRPCGGVNELVDQHIAQIDRQISKLVTLRSELSQLPATSDSTRPAASCETLTAQGNSCGPRSHGYVEISVAWSNLADLPIGRLLCPLIPFAVARKNNPS